MFCVMKNIKNKTFANKNEAFIWVNIAEIWIVTDYEGVWDM